MDIALPDDRPVMILDQVFNAAPARLWQAWFDPKELEAWWGPEGMTNRDAAIDPRPGGAWTITMVGPDGATFVINSVIYALTEPRHMTGIAPRDGFRGTAEELVASHQTNGMQDIAIAMDLHIDPVAGGAHMRIIQTFPDIAARDANTAMGAEAGWGGSFRKLERLLATD